MWCVSSPISVLSLAVSCVYETTCSGKTCAEVAGFAGAAAAAVCAGRGHGKHVDGRHVVLGGRVSAKPPRRVSVRLRVPRVLERLWRSAHQGESSKCGTVSDTGTITVHGK
eukprot:2787059-Rhodomonas_salina.4